MKLSGHVGAKIIALEYNVFFMFLIYFFLLNSNPMSASLKSLGIFLHSRSKVNFKVKYDF